MENIDTYLYAMRIASHLAEKYGIVIEEETFEFIEDCVYDAVADYADESNDDEEYWDELD